MDTQTYFTYAAGTPEQIRNGDLDKIPNGRSPKGLIEYLQSPRGKIILPLFIGVYQRKRAISHTVEEKSLVEEWQREIQAVSDIQAYLARVNLFSINGRMDCLDSSLISVLYNSAIWSKGNVRELLRDSTNRIAIIPVKKAPNFDDKEVQTIELIIEEETKRMIRGEGRLDILKKMAKKIGRVAEELGQYGLTTQEYVIWKIHEEVRNSHAESQILVPDIKVQASPMDVMHGKLLVEGSREEKGFLKRLQKIFEM